MENKKHTFTRTTIALGITGVIVLASVGTASAINSNGDDSTFTPRGLTSLDHDNQGRDMMNSEVNIPDANGPQWSEQMDRNHDNMMGSQADQTGVQQMDRDRDRIMEHQGGQDQIQQMYRDRIQEHQGDQDQIQQMDRDRDRDRTAEHQVDQSDFPQMDRDRMHQN